MWDLTVEIQEFQFDKHYDIRSLLWRNLPTMHNWYQSKVSPGALAHHREQSVGGHQTSHGACPVSPQWELDSEVTWPQPAGGNYLVDKAKQAVSYEQADLRPSDQQLLRNTHHPLPMYFQSSYFLKTIFTKLRKYLTQTNQSRLHANAVKTLHFPSP